MNTPGSKFAGLLQAARGEAAALDAPAAVAPGTGKRPRGKRSDPDFEQVGAYIRRDTYRAVRRELLDDDGDFSELVEELLAGWLKQRGRPLG